MALPDLGPGQGAVEEALGVLGHCGSQLDRAALDAVRRPGGVGRQLGGIVINVGGPAAFGLADVGLDQLAPMVDVHQLTAQPDLHLPARRTPVPRHRVQGLLTLDVMVRMHRGITPVGDVVGLTVPGQQGVALFLLKDHQWQPPRGAVDPLASHLDAPPPRFGPHVAQPVEIAALEEALPHVLHAPLHFGLVLGAPDASGVGDETAVLRVFQKAPGEARVQRIGSRHRGRTIVDHQVTGNAAEESPRRLQASDDVLQRLPVGRPDKAVPRVAQHDDQRPHRFPAARRWVRNHPQPAEVHLRHFSRWSVLHAHRGLAAALPVALQDEAAQRRIRYPAAPDFQQLPNAGHLQPVPSEPLENLVGPRLQQVLSGRLHLPRPHLADGRQHAQLLLGGSRTVLSYARALGGRDVLGNGISRQAGAHRNLALAISSLPASDDVLYLHSGYLPVRHRCTSKSKCGNGRRCGSQSGLMTLKIWQVDPENLLTHWPIDHEN